MITIITISAEIQNTKQGAERAPFQINFCFISYFSFLLFYCYFFDKMRVERKRNDAVVFVVIIIIFLHTIRSSSERSSLNAWRRNLVVVLLLLVCTIFPRNKKQ